MKKIVLFLVCLPFILCAEVATINQKNLLNKEPVELYIDLMKKCLANTIYEDPSISPFCPGSYKNNCREHGYDWPQVAHTMIGMKRLNNLHFCVKSVLENNIPGDLVETGVWRGGATILMRAILKAYGNTDRRVWVADSFEGLPPPNPEKYPEDKGYDLQKFTVLAISLEEVKSNFSKYDLLDDQVVFLKGLFSNTLPNAPIEKIAVLRLDGDLYESTMDALNNLYEKVSFGGYVIIDDYYALPPCAKATHDFRDAHNITDKILPIDGMGVYWQKTKPSSAPAVSAPVVIDNPI